MEIFKIRSKKTGLYSGGRRYPSWTKTGKAWTSDAKLLGHLYMFTDYKGNVSIPEDWEIVTFTVVELGNDSAKEAMTKYLEAMKVYKEELKSAKKATPNE